MDRVFKRVAEGVTIFDSIYEKLKTTENHSQKEKLESDLKREIKKLQRLRDQIKTWIGSNEIKDKKQLMEQRKLIETEMERFKACEKEMKTKAYSKEGLTNSLKLDPKEKKKVETSDFVSTMMEELEHQVEALEAEQETLQAKKNRKDTSKQERLSEIDESLERHKWHIDRLEIILRKLENGDVSPEAIENIREDIKYYVESNQEVDFAEDDEIYDELNLDYEEENDSESIGRDETPSYSLDDLASESGSIKDQKEPSFPAVPTTRKVSSASISATSPTMSSSAIHNSTTVIPALKPAQPPARSVNELKYASAAAGTSGSLSPTTEQHSSIIITSTSQSSSIGNLDKIPTRLTIDQKPSSISVEDRPTSSRILDAVNSAKISTEDTSVDLTLHIQQPTNNSNSQESTKPLNLPPGVQDLIGSFEAAKNRIGAPPPIGSITKMLESSFINCPDTFLSNKPSSSYQPTTPFPTPAYYPQEPLAILNTPEILSKMDVDTLFYIFYYRQGTYQQLLAAKELKKRSWRYNKRFLTWFQRHEEPKVITNDYEQGSYRYFDFEGSWLQRRKSNFKFEYQFLEDEELKK